MGEGATRTRTSVDLAVGLAGDSGRKVDKSVLQLEMLFLWDGVIPCGAFVVLLNLQRGASSHLSSGIGNLDQRKSANGCSLE